MLRTHITKDKDKFKSKKNEPWYFEQQILDTIIG